MQQNHILTRSPYCFSNSPNPASILTDDDEVQLIFSSATPIASEDTWIKSRCTSSVLKDVAMQHTSNAVNVNALRMACDICKYTATRMCDLEKHKLKKHTSLEILESSARKKTIVSKSSKSSGKTTFMSWHWMLL